MYWNRSSYVYQMHAGGIVGPGNHLGKLEYDGKEIASVKAMCCTALLSIAKRYILAFSQC
jgi:hypothetical protein